MPNICYIVPRSLSCTSCLLPHFAKRNRDEPANRIFHSKSQRNPDNLGSIETLYYAYVRPLIRDGLVQFSGHRVRRHLEQLKIMIGSKFEPKHIFWLF